MNRFWIVMRDGNLMPTSFRHTSRESAKEEAIRLSKINPAAKFFVAAVTGYAQCPVENSWHEMEKANDL